MQSKGRLRSSSFLFVLFCLIAAFHTSPGYTQCTDPNYPIFCEGYDIYGYYYAWCCPANYPVCGSNYLECYSGTSESTTTIPFEPTTTIPGIETTTTIPGTVTTSTVPGGTTGDFIVGINTNGQDSRWTESSGILPGTSPARTTPALMRANGRIVPQWHDTVPELEPGLMKEWKQQYERQQSTASAKTKYALGVGEQKSFWVKDSKDTTWRQVQATCAREGQHGLIFVDTAITVPDTALDSYVTEFDKMFQILSEAIGEFIDRDGNGKVSILLYNFNDGADASMYMAGYFWQKDYYYDSQTSTQGYRSNEMDVIYIRGNLPTNWEQVGTDFYESTLSTLIHEYQHMVNFCITNWSQGNNGGNSGTWINEMMSLVSETMYYQEKLRENPAFTSSEVEGNGYMSNRILYYNLDQQNSIRNGHGLTYWDTNGVVLANYSLSYLFGIYLATHSSSGYDIFKQILDYMVANKVYDYQAVAAVAVQQIAGITSWEDLLKNWAIANMANQPSGLFGYKGSFVLTPHGPAFARANLNCGGVVYRTVSGEVSAPAGAGPDVRFFDANGNALQGSGGPCPSSLILGETSSESMRLRNFRDTVLQATPAGAQLVATYYRHAPELVGLLLLDDTLADQVKDLLTDILPSVDSAIKGRTFAVSTATEERIHAVCDRIARKAGPELRDTIERLREDFMTGKLVADLGLSS